MNGIKSFAVVCLATYTSAFQLDQQPRASVNPFSRTTNYYVNPVFKSELQTSIDTSDSISVKNYMQGMMESPSSYWIDRKSVISGTGTTKTMQGILADAAHEGLEEGSKKLVVLMVYDLPNRDCHVS